MGSRRKKATVRIFPTVLDVYKKLNINDRIAFKVWLYWHGRQRLHFYQYCREKTLEGCEINIVNSGYWAMHQPN